MQYTAKIALLAVALFGTSALAAPFAGDAEYDIEAREVDNNDLTAREFYDVYMEARSNPSLDARDLESLDFEAREYLDYLEARELAAAAPPQSPMTPSTPSTPQTPEIPHGESHVESHEHSVGGSTATTGSEHPHIFLTKHQKAVHRLKKVAAKKFKDVEFYHHALLDKASRYHRFAVLKYLSKPKHLKKALANTDSPYHHAAKRVLHRHKAKVYLSEKANYKKALKHKHNKFHKDAVKKYLSHGHHFKHALTHKKARFHKAAVHEYLLDKKTRAEVLADQTSPFYKAAVKLQKKIEKHREHLSLGSGSGSPPATPSTESAVSTPPSAPAVNGPGSKASGSKA